MKRSAEAGTSVEPTATAVEATVQAPMPAAVRAALEALPAGRYLLAVSGGRDSMVLLDAFAACRSDAVGVATFDHGTGAAATRAARHVVRACERVGVPVYVGGAGASATRRPARSDRRAPLARASLDEASLRSARWAFLARTANGLGARVVTAHTRDDQVETVFMRILRSSGARGLAGMLAPSPVARPLIEIARADLAACAAARGVTWVEDPSNASAVYLRNRVRAELLPAAERARPGFSAWLLDLSGRAAAWRAEVAAVADELLGASEPGMNGARVAWPEVLQASATNGRERRAFSGGGSAGRPAREARPAASPRTQPPQESGPSEARIVVPLGAIAGFTPDAAAMLWAEFAGRVGAALDRRGVARLRAEASNLPVGGVVPLSGGVTVIRTVSTFVIRNPGGGSPLY